MCCAVEKEKDSDGPEGRVFEIVVGDDHALAARVRRRHVGKCDRGDCGGLQRRSEVVDGTVCGGAELMGVGAGRSSCQGRDTIKATQLVRSRPRPLMRLAKAGGDATLSVRAVIVERPDERLGTARWLHLATANPAQTTARPGRAQNRYMLRNGPGVFSTAPPRGPGRGRRVRHELSANAGGGD